MSQSLNSTYQILERNPGRLIAVIGFVTALLAIPFLTMAPDTSASTEPTGDVFTARDRIDESFVSSMHPTGLILEHESGDLLTVEALGSLFEASQSLRDDPNLGPTLSSYYEDESDFEVRGIVTIADLVDRDLRSEGIDGIRAARDADVRRVGSTLIDRFGNRSDVLAISAQSTRDESGWTVPAISPFVLSNNSILGFGNTSVNLGGSTEIEEFDREIQEVFRVDGWQANGIAIDVNLTSQEQGAVAGPFIGFTILAILLLVGLTFRSYWVLATVSVAFVALIIWLKGISNLIGLEDDLVLSLIVPVAMVSFGVDFAFHAIGRYREQRAEGHTSGPAIITGMTAVSGALVLALTSDATAFLANLTSGIESIEQFGIGAAIALCSAFLLLGVVAPIVVAHIEGIVPAPTPGRRSAIVRIAGAVVAAGLTMASVLFLVFILPWVGLILAPMTAIGVLGLPFLRQRRMRSTEPVGSIPLTSSENALAVRVGRAVASLALRPRLVLPVAIAITAASAIFAVQVPAAFDVEDFFSSDTDFVVGLEQLDRHVGDRGGEPALVYVEGDLTSPANLGALSTRVAEIQSLPTPSLARDADGLVQIDTGVLEVLEESLQSALMISLVEQDTGISINDADGDNIPDTSEQVEAVLVTAAQRGIPIDESRLLLTPDDVNTVFQFGEPSSADRTVFAMGVVDSRSQESVTESRAALDPIADAMSGDLDGSFVQVTGSAFVREASLDATNRALFVSLPVALVLCLIVGASFLRSIRYGVASIIPIVMVVAWLYAFMYGAGFSINLVTATIAAVSIGIGIDFAIHFIARFREELERHGNRQVAVRITGEGTGLALVASATSSAIGFGILAFAPMPLFAAYGMLTALMIVMALVATLAVLPSILVLITSDVDASDPATDPTIGSPRSTVNVQPRAERGVEGLKRVDQLVE